MGNMSDGLNMQPRIGEPETSQGSSARPAGGLLATLGANIPDTSIGPVALQEAPRWVYDFDPSTGVARASFVGQVVAGSIDTPAAGVSSFNGRSGTVVLTGADLEAAGGLANPDVVLEGNPTAPTPAIGDASASIATTAYVQTAIASAPKVASFNGRSGAVLLTTGDVTGAGGAPLTNANLLGVPTAPTASVGDTSSQIATDAFVANALAAGTVTSFNGRHGAVSLTLSDVQSVGGAPIASPNFTGTPSGPTAAPATATTQLASTAFVMAAITAGTAGVASVNTRTGAVVLNAADLTAMGGAPINAPTFTGAAHAPTPSAGDNSTLIATTAFVDTALASLPAGVSTFNGRAGTVTLTLPDVTSVGGAPLASPAFSGSPSAPTAPPGDNSTRIADTAFVAAALAALPSIPATPTTTPLMDGTATIGASGQWAQADHIHPSDTSRYSATNPSGFQTAAQVTTSVNNGIATRLPLTGGSLTGGLNVAGSINIPATAGNTTPGVALMNSASTVLSQWNASATTGNVSIAANITGPSLLLSGDIQMSPGAGHNLLLNVGAGFQAGGGPWNSLSDERIKDVHGDYTQGLDKITALRPVVYSYKGNDEIDNGEGEERTSINRAAADAGTQFVGLIAQEVEAIFPDMVTTRAGFIDGKPVDDLRVLNTTPLTFALINAVKQLLARIEVLEERATAP